MEDRANTALFTTRIIANDDNLLGDLKNNNAAGIIEEANGYLESSEADILRIYNSFGEIIASPDDPRLRGEVITDDNLITFSIIERKLIRSFDTHPGVLSPFIIARAIHPLIVDNTIVGAVEVGYKFDNAFVDFSKEQTNLDVTIYADKKISATTIKTLDGVSRFIGSNETRTDIIDQVLINGIQYTTSVDRFGETYYTAFTPIREVNGDIIGMISVGTPTFLLIEETRQQLITAFILVTVVSSFVALLSYFAIPELKKNKPSRGK